MDVWAAVAALNSGESTVINIELVPGDYVLVCNFNPNGIEFPAHYEEGMYRAFTATE